MRRLSRGLCIALCLTVPVVWAGCASTPTRQSTGEYVDDSVLTAKVKTELGADKMVNLFTIGVETYNGVVQLSGFVNTREQAEHAASIAQKVKGVRDVKEFRTVRRPSQGAGGCSATRSSG